MLNELSTILLAFFPCFSRVAAFQWFVVIILGLIVRLDFHGVTSFVRWLALDPEHYETLLSIERTASDNATTEEWAPTCLGQRG